MIQIISMYLLVGLIYTILLDWILKNYSARKEGFDIKHSLWNITLWPLAMYLVYHAYKDKDDEDFVSNLYKKTILKHSEYEKDIEEKTPNWEKERIADIDLILIKMAISEFLHFPSIPTKVTINEYIEISKDYSTEKSSYFINGVLDRISKEFIKNKRIVKIGRGLL